MKVAFLVFPGNSGRWKTGIFVCNQNIHRVFLYKSILVIQLNIPKDVDKHVEKD